MKKMYGWIIKRYLGRFSNHNFYPTTDADQILLLALGVETDLFICLFKD